MNSTDLTPRDCNPAREPLAADLLAGLRGRPKQISPAYFYDARGSELFDAICELPEYYLTRIETPFWKLMLQTSHIASARMLCSSNSAVARA
jgi:uncharacterized SAM-dependent methyltransferase